MFIRVLFTIIWEIIENYFDIWHYIDDIKEWENAKKKIIKKTKNRTKQNQKKQKTQPNFGKDADLRIPWNWTVIRDKDVELSLSYL